MDKIFFVGFCALYYIILPFFRLPIVPNIIPWTVAFKLCFATHHLYSVYHKKDFFIMKIMIWLLLRAGNIIR